MFDPQATPGIVGKTNNGCGRMGVPGISVGRFSRACSDRDCRVGDGFRLYKLNKLGEDKTKVWEKGGEVSHSSRCSRTLSNDDILVCTFVSPPELRGDFTDDVSYELTLLCNFQAIQGSHSKG